MTYPVWPPVQQQPRQNALQRLWSRANPLQRAGLIIGALLLLCCGGVTGVGAIGSAFDSPQTATPQGIADDQPEYDAADATTEPTEPTTPATEPPSASPSPAEPSPTVEKRTVLEKRAISFKTRTVKDSSLAKGKKEVRKQGANGERTLTYEITVTDGVETGKRLISSKVTKQPVTKVVAVGTRSEARCDPNYSGACVPIDSDVDCAGGSGNGPSYVRGVVRVVGEDIYDLDRDNDGYGCD